MRLPVISLVSAMRSAQLLIFAEQFKTLVTVNWNIVRSTEHKSYITLISSISPRVVWHLESLRNCKKNKDSRRSLQDVIKIWFIYR